jgi:uncharacterized membrane-anchored protein YhcB (DUF1043 family)
MASRNTELVSNGLTCAFGIVNIGLLWTIHNQQNDVQRHLDQRNAIVDEFSRKIDKQFDDFSNRLRS